MSVVRGAVMCGDGGGWVSLCPAQLRNPTQTRRRPPTAPRTLRCSELRPARASWTCRERPHGRLSERAEMVKGAGRAHEGLS